MTIKPIYKYFFLLNFSAPYRKIQSYDNILSKRSGIFLKIFAIVYTVIMRVFFLIILSSKVYF